MYFSFCYIYIYIYIYGLPQVQQATIGYLDLPMGSIRYHGLPLGLVYPDLQLPQGSTGCHNAFIYLYSNICVCIYIYLFVFCVLSIFVFLIYTYVYMGYHRLNRLPQATQAGLADWPGWPAKAKEVRSLLKRVRFCLKSGSQVGG